MGDLMSWVCPLMATSFPLKKELLEARETAVGNDVVFLPNFRSSFNELFRKKIYTEQEIEYCEMFDEPMLRYASTWAAKESVYKAVKQLENTKLGLKSIEIIRDKPSGRPEVILHKPGLCFTVSLSISHDGDYVWAIALVKRP